ncbi:OLC1v1013837C1 [Oldenlandia corymbosa var. corymbosa]|uniref:OLC1v1013837C1 n=1 Tax=Oldenlandia corymbosa var. corymbosa TaxID=529605 RepID=A0AAV1E2P7_OLDCO|nr:OLC1v1013837C1 [Oldenlandia corymbosa var. corymbosa]
MSSKFNFLNELNNSRGVGWNVRVRLLRVWTKMDFNDDNEISKIESVLIDEKFPKFADIINKRVNESLLIDIIGEIVTVGKSLNYTKNCKKGYVSSSDISKSLSYTPLLINPVNINPIYFKGEPSAEYYVRVTSIRVNEKPVSINSTLLSINDDGNGGTKISTVVPYTVMETSIYNALTNAFSQAFSGVPRVKPGAPFGLCFNSSNSPTVMWRIFGSNSLVRVKEDVLCFGFVDGECTDLFPVFSTFFCPEGFTFLEMIFSTISLSGTHRFQRRVDVGILFSTFFRRNFQGFKQQLQLKYWILCLRGVLRKLLVKSIFRISCGGRRSQTVDMAINLMTLENWNEELAPDQVKAGIRHSSDAESNSANNNKNKKKREAAAAKTKSINYNQQQRRWKKTAAVLAESPVSNTNDKRQQLQKSNKSEAAASATTSMATEAVGFQDHAKSIIDLLQRGSQNLRVVAIVGMPGLVDKRRVLQDLLSQIDPEKFSTAVTYDKKEHGLADLLRKSLKGRRYIIVLDDVWDIEAWQGLQESFPDDSKGSRIMLTSRCHNVTPPSILDAYELAPLNEEESLDLIQRKLFDGKGWPPKSDDIQKQMHQVCAGLPLTIILLVGVLKSVQQAYWKGILENLGSSKLSERCKDTLELSYRHLPEHLKPCLLYFAAFPEDEDVSVKRLTNLWTAEGFVQKVGSKPLSVVAEDYLNDLICRSLLMTTQKKSMGGVKTCRIHDLLYEFCLQKTKEEQFFHFVGVSCDEMLTLNEPRCMRRLCINSNGKCFLESKVCYARVHSLRFKYVDRHFYRRSISFLMHTSKLLRVLDLENVFMNWVIPGEIGFLVHLAYLAIGFSSSTIPPTSIGNLCNLQTFILQYYDQCDGFIRIPNTFWNLQTLKHFYVRRVGRLVAYGRLPLENLDSASVMFELDKISGLEIPLENMEEVMKKFPNIRRLRLTLRYGADLGGNHPNIAIPNFLKTLESLNMRTARPIPHCYNLYVVGMFSFPENLKKLTLTNFDLSESSVSSLGTLPNLEVLYLVNTGFEGDTWRMEEGGEFAKLRILGLDAPKLRRWTGSEDQFVCLEKLEVRCDCLKEMPSCLGYISTLQMIEVKHCPSSVGKLVKDIEKVQKDYGNSDLKIIMKEEYTCPNSENRSMFESLRFRFTQLKMFALSATKFLGPPLNARLESLLGKIEDAVGRINVTELTLENLNNRFREGNPLYDSIAEFNQGCTAFREEMYELYGTLLKTTNPGSNSLTKDEVLEIITFFLDSLKQYISEMSYCPLENIEALLEASKVQMTFLKNLILFVTQRDVDPAEAIFWPHAEIVAIRAARLLAVNTRYVQQADFSFVKMIMPVDPQVYQTYTGALIRSSRNRVSPVDGERDDDKSLIATENLLRSLISILWEASAVNTFVAVPMTGELLELYEGLRSLMKMILKLKQPNKSDLKIKEEIVTVVCDSGIFIFSLYQKNVKSDIRLLPDLLEAIKNLVGLEEKDPQVPEFNYRGTTQLAFVDFLLQRLEELASRDAEQTSKDCARSVCEELVGLRSFLGDILELHFNQVEIQTLRDRVLEVAYKVEDFTEYLESGDFPNCLSPTFDSIMKDIADIKSRIKAVKRPKTKLKRQDIKVKETASDHNNQVQAKTNSIATGGCRLPRPCKLNH